MSDKEFLKKDLEEIEESKEEIIEKSEVLKAKVGSLRLNMRKDATIFSEVLEVLEPGSEVEVEDFDDEWVIVNFGDLSGFCMKQYLDFE